MVRVVLPPAPPSTVTSFQAPVLCIWPTQITPSSVITSARPPTVPSSAWYTPGSVLVDDELLDGGVDDELLDGGVDDELLDGGVDDELLDGGVVDDELTGVVSVSIV